MLITPLVTFQQHIGSGTCAQAKYAVPSGIDSDTCMVMVEDYDQLGSAKSGVFAIRAGPLKKGRPLDAGVLVGGCEIRADDDPGSPFP